MNPEQFVIEKEVRYIVARALVEDGMDWRNPHKVADGLRTMLRLHGWSKEEISAVSHLLIPHRL